MHYVRCKTCGRYIDPSLAVQKFYCSEDCARSFARCANCGSYFAKGGGYDEQTCSQACSIRYSITRLHGATPAGADSEESK